MLHSGRAGVGYDTRRSRRFSPGFGASRNDQTPGAPPNHEKPFPSPPSVRALRRSECDEAVRPGLTGTSMFIQGFDLDGANEFSLSIQGPHPASASGTVWIASPDLFLGWAAATRSIHRCLADRLTWERIGDRPSRDPSLTQRGLSREHGKPRSRSSPRLAASRSRMSRGVPRNRARIFPIGDRPRLGGTAESHLTSGL